MAGTRTSTHILQRKSRAGRKMPWPLYVTCKLQGFTRKQTNRWRRLDGMGVWGHVNCPLSAADDRLEQGFGGGGGRFSGLVGIVAAPRCRGAGHRPSRGRGGGIGRLSVEGGDEFDGWGWLDAGEANASPHDARLPVDPRWPGIRFDMCWVYFYFYLRFNADLQRSCSGEGRSLLPCFDMYSVPRTAIFLLCTFLC